MGDFIRGVVEHIRETLSCIGSCVVEIIVIVVSATIIGIIFKYFI
jgi:hypothetical protein